MKDAVAYFGFRQVFRQMTSRGKPSGKGSA
jgi:hypothetical protein